MVKKIAILLLFLTCQAKVFGTHLRGGQITVNTIDCGARIYEITLTIYTNTISPLQAGGGTLNFGDGNSVIVPSLPNTVIDATNAVGQAVFKVNHTYLVVGGFTVSYGENNRNSGIVNLQNSGATPLYIESYFLVDPFVPCIPPIAFSIPPIDRACSGLLFTHNPGVAASPNADAFSSDSISYQITVPLMAKNTPVAGYQNPNAVSFYAGNYQTSNEEGTGTPTYQIGADGTLVWDAPGFAGEYALAIKVFQWIKVNGVWVNTDWVERDMQVIVEDCNATRPYLVLPPDVCIQPGSILNQTIRGYDADASPITIQVTTVDKFYSSTPAFINESISQSTAAPNDTANIKVNWNISCDLVKTPSYKFIFKISTYSKSRIRISTFQTWNVTVVGSPPVYKSLSLDLSTKKLNLQWDNYPCPNAPTVQVWRRVDKNLVQNNDCVIGIPKSWGFSQIGETSNGTFTDKLDPGGTYCYRLIAIYTAPHQTVSISSKDTCIGPIVADAPVIINASVIKTDKTNGSISVKWTPPFQINKTLFPSPYEYQVLRTKDGNNYKNATSAKISDTTFVDNSLDVSDSLYGYKIIVYSPNSIARDNPIDTSALAFYPRLSGKPVKDTLKLSWTATVPWSDQDPRFPFHFIYRKNLGAANYSLMDSVNVLSDGYKYSDYGGKSGFPLDPNTLYQYKIETQGAYGNPHIKEPLENFSNEIIGQPVDTTPPCPPRLEISAVSCETLLSTPCTVNTFSNKLSWTYPAECGNDVSYYKVFFSSSQRADSVLIGSPSDLNYVDQRQNSMAGCYQVFSVDRSGNVSSPSPLICVDNCTNVFVPNVITVNGDDLNETFPGINNANDTRDPSKCPRFIKEFSMEIYNRWGQVVYTTTNSQVGQPNTEWKGLDQRGQELPTGVYYYSANIMFYSLDPKVQSKEVKGWVSLVR